MWRFKMNFSFVNNFVVIPHVPGPAPATSMGKIRVVEFIKQVAREDQRSLEILRGEARESHI